MHNANDDGDNQVSLQQIFEPLDPLAPLADSLTDLVPQNPELAPFIDEFGRVRRPRRKIKVTEEREVVTRKKVEIIGPKGTKVETQTSKDHSAGGFTDILARSLKLGAQSQAEPTSSSTTKP